MADLDWSNPAEIIRDKYVHSIAMAEQVLLETKSALDLSNGLISHTPAHSPTPGEFKNG